MVNILYSSSTTAGSESSVNSSRTNAFSDNILKAVFRGAISNYLDEVEQLEKTVGQDASVAEARSIQPYLKNALARNVDSL